MDRRDFLRLTAGGALASAAIGCSRGSGAQRSVGDSEQTSAGTGRSTLRIAQWGHYIPAYDAWFDGEYVKRWGEEHDVEVVVDHIPPNELPFRGDAEAAAGRGHDLFWFLNPRPVLEDDVIDHRDVVEEVTAKLGAMSPHVERSVFNPHTKRYFGFPGHWTPGPLHYRVDLWNAVEPGLQPSTWDDIRRAGAPLKAGGHPLGLGISTDLDSMWTLHTLLTCYGARLQDENANPAINSRATVEAVKVCAEIYRTGMTEEVFSWDGFSNNRLLATGRGSLIINAVSALRATEQQDPELAAKIALAPIPTAVTGDRPRSVYVVGCYVIWKFSPHRELAERFLVDLALSSREVFLQSQFYNLPAFPGGIPDVASLASEDPAARPADKYSILADAAGWSTNAGHPGYLNAAVDEIISGPFLSTMFADVARGQLTAEESVERAVAEAAPIFDKWRERGKI